MNEVWQRLKKWAWGWMTGGPHFIVGQPDNPYLYRWYIIPRNPWCNIYLHKFLRDDDDRALHDHPWRSISFLIRGQYVEETATGRKLYRTGSIIRRTAEYAHRVELPDGKQAWTLFITGPVVREWGFHCKAGWRHWKEFTAVGQPGQIGRGCD